jgi:bacterioferritin (cytochrome b1)
MAGGSRQAKLPGRAAQVCREEGDNASKVLFERLLKDEEEHLEWLEAQVYQIGEVGYERYLSQQIRGLSALMRGGCMRACPA